MKLFARRREDFHCANCGLLVAGDGYTNHCPRCLFSLHVDRNPGDRAEDCGGLMEPIAVAADRKGYRLLHRCRRCGVERPVRARDDDDFEALLKLARRQGGRAG